MASANFITSLMMFRDPGDVGSLDSSQKNLPSHEVKQSTGMDCAYFTEKAFIKNIERQSNGN